MWNPKQWADDFKDASRRRDSAAIHDLRIAVFRSTVDVVRERGYELDGNWISIDEEGHYESLVSETVFYPKTDDLEVPESRRGTYRTLVDIKDADCLEIARALGEAGEVAAVLNMASRRNPGGGASTGAGAQEESLFRRSALLHSLYQFAPYAAKYDVPTSPDGLRYPIPRDSGGIYSPPTVVFRASARNGYAFLPDPYRAAFLTVPAISRPDLIEAGGEFWLSDPVAEATQRKIRAILRIGAHHGHADLVLSAFGCGAFRNPPQHVARLFRETLEAPEFAGVFRQIVFAIIDDHNAGKSHNPEGNFAPFERELSGL